MPDLQVETGYVASIIFNKDDYYVLAVKGPEKSFKARGSLFGLVQVKVGVSLKLEGAWVNHPKFGLEFHFNGWDCWSPTVADANNFLNTCINGFRDFRVLDALIGRYQGDIFKKLATPNEILSETFEGVSRESVEAAVLGWTQTVAKKDLAVLLRQGEISTFEIQAALLKFGTSASTVIRENPYRLMEVQGPSFVKVERLALKLGLKPTSPKRLQGAILWALRDGASQGNLYLKRGEILANIDRLFKKDNLIEVPHDPKVFDQAVIDLLKARAVVLDKEVGLYLPEYYEYERRSAELLVGMTNPPPIKTDLGPFLDAYEKGHSLTLSPGQKAAVGLIADHRTLVITGLPGTGKTSVLKVLVRLLEEEGLKLSLMAPTGIAAKRLAHVTGRSASTVHRALGYDGSSWSFNSSNRYLADAVILDEASMLDQELFYRLLSAIRPDTRLILVGDDAQLPSVGPGNVLRELVGCSAIPTVRLTEIFRQAAKGGIVTNSHKINAGEAPYLINDPNSEFRFVDCWEESSIVDQIIEIAKKLKSKNANFQVLSPKYEGVVGVDNLNERLREVLNPPGPKEWYKFGVRYRLGDRVMVIQNDYKLGQGGVYNGDVGKIIYIGKTSLIVKIHGIGKNADEEVEFPEDAVVDKLKLAYAISCHKSQGSEYETIIMPIVKSQGVMLQRNLLYTAVTRAKKRVLLLGEAAAVQKAVENNKVIKRNTAFSKVVTLGVQVTHDSRAD